MEISIAKPSKLISKICLETVGQRQMFKFNDNLQMRMEELLDKKKANSLTPDDALELESIGELDRILTHMNAMSIAQSPEFLPRQ